MTTRRFFASIDARLITVQRNLFSATLIAGKGNFLHRQIGFLTFAGARVGETHDET
jgi:hypothetical protein